MHINIFWFKSKLTLKFSLKFLTVFFLISFLSLVAETDNKEASLQEFIIHHVADSNEWHPLPFHLFSIVFPNYDFGNLQFKNGLHAMMLLLGSLFLLFIFGVLYRKDSKKAPKGLVNALEVLVLFVRNEICINYLGEKEGRKFAPLFLNFFFFILILNIMSLIPLFSTATANINVTGGFALITFTLMVGCGLIQNGPIGFFKLFIPPGVPVPVLFILVPIEMVGFLIKPFALTIRLFANMLAGHLIIFSIIGLVITFGVVGLPSLFLALFVYILEILVAFLQAYIFTMLSAMFLGEVLHPQH